MIIDEKLPLSKKEAAFVLNETYSWVSADSTPKGCFAKTSAERGESSKTSLTLTILSTYSTDPFVDTLLNGYASLYDRGLICSPYSWGNCP